ncbi:MAG TPA: hypothetical protein VJ484_12165 [Lysobacter sp.]|nr:hypothetical protein [Lysobacter sp.]
MKESALDDWDSVLAPIVGGVPNPPANSGATFINDQNNAGTQETSAFFGSNKDIHAINTWERKTSGLSPDKDNITNAYAKSYSVDHDDNPATPSHLFIYFGADRFANDGDAALGFWFFKNEVTVAASGPKSSFSGVHSTDDILVQVDFVNGGAKSEIQIFRWVGSGGSHGALDEIKFASSSGFVVCTDDDTACAVTNQGDNVTCPWTYIPKGSTVDSNFPHESFYEGGIDITALIGQACFSSFMAETRSSHSETAELKDYALGDFNLCSVMVTKQCRTGTTPVVDPTGTFLTTTLDITVTNNGFGPIFNTAFEEDIEIPDTDTGILACRLTSPVVDNDLDQNELKEIFAGELAPGASATATVQCDHTTSKVFNNVTARAAATPGGARDITDSYEMAAEDTCELLVTPTIDVTKACKTVTIVEVDGTLQPKVCNTITLTNNSNEKLVNVSLVDTPANADPETLITGGDLDPGESITPIEHCYIPTATDNGTEEPEEATFSNEVLASADGAISKVAASDSDNVQCKLCPPPQSEALH